MEPLRAPPDAARWRAGSGRPGCSRYEALNLLLAAARTTTWSSTSVLRESADQPGHQNFVRPDERPVATTPDRSCWHGPRNAASSPSVFQVRGASYAVAGHARRRLGWSLHDWRRAACRCSTGPGSRPRATPLAERCVAQVCRSTSAVVLQDELRDAGVVPPSTRPQVAWSRTRSNPSVQLRRLDRPSRRDAGSAIRRSRCWQRLLFEACFEPRGVRMATSDLVARRLAVRARGLERASRPATTARTRRAAARCCARRRRSATSGDERARGRAPARRPTIPRTSGSPTTMIGDGRAWPYRTRRSRGAGRRRVVRAPDAVLPRHGRGRAAPRIWPGTRRCPATTRAAARWWLEQGSRIRRLSDGEGAERRRPPCGLAAPRTPPGAPRLDEARSTSGATERPRHSLFRGAVVAQQTPA